MVNDLREVVESPQYQGVDEELVYALTTTNFGSSPSSPSVVVKDMTAGGDGTDVTANVTSGSASVFGDIVTLPTILDLTAGSFYRVEIQFTSGSNLFECFFYIRARE